MEILSSIILLFYHLSGISPRYSIYINVDNLYLRINIFSTYEYIVVSSILPVLRHNTYIYGNNLLYTFMCGVYFVHI